MATMHDILFVCTSNTCRSPMAEALAKRWFADKLGVSMQTLGERVSIGSGGLTDAYEPHGSPPSAHGVTAMLEHGLDTSAHRSTVLTAQQMAHAKRIYCVSAGHCQHIAEALGRPLDPAWCTPLSPGQGIPDPWHGPLHEYVATAAFMKVCVPDVMSRDWAAGQFAWI